MAPRVTLRRRSGRLPDKGGSQYGSSDDESETMSMLSVESSAHRGSQDTDVADEEPCEQNFDRLKMYIEEAIESKSSPRRAACLQWLCRTFAAGYFPDFLSSRPATMADLVEKSLKKGKPEEQMAASNLAALLVLQYGSSPQGAEVHNTLTKTFIKNLRDRSTPAKVREKIAGALAITTFFAEDEIHIQMEVMDLLATVFSESCGPKGDMKMPNVSPAESSLHQTALLSWALLLTVSEEQASGLIERNLPSVTTLLQSPDVDLRIAAGETLATIYEIGRDRDIDFEGDDLAELCEELHTLATDSQKFRSERDRRFQRASFREIERAIRDRDTPNFNVQFGREALRVRTWEDKRTYDAMCSFLGTGMNHHLQFNPEIRHFFGLGEPLPINPEIRGTVGNKIDRAFHNLNDKMRTKRLAKYRDKRSDTV